MYCCGGGGSGNSISGQWKEKKERKWTSASEQFRATADEDAADALLGYYHESCVCSIDTAAARDDLRLMVLLL